MLVILSLSDNSNAACAGAVTNNIPTAITTALQLGEQPSTLCLPGDFHTGPYGGYDAGGRILDGEAYNTA